jgi:putative long chain acyl-CoA synthase
MGRPLPGSAEVRIAAYDVESRKLVLRADGFAIECGDDEIGMLLARVRPTDPTSSTQLRGVFSRDDAWLATGDLFRRDRDGDYWRVDGVNDVIRGPEGPVFTGPIRDALSDIPAIDLAVAYGVAPTGSEHQLPIAAVTLRAGHELTGQDLGHALAALPPGRRPAIVHVVEQIPVTTWFRPLTSPLREAGIPEPHKGRSAWYRYGAGDSYRPLTDAAHRRLVKRAA